MHQHTLIAGQTGCGKTTLVKALLKRTARAVVFDPEVEYDLPGAVVVDTLPEAMDAFVRLRWQRFVLVCRFDSEGDRTAADQFVCLLNLIMHAQETEPHGPILAVVEESSLISTTYDMDATIHDIMNRGRKRRLSLLLIIQLDSDIHRVARANSRVIVTMYSHQTSNRFERYFDPAAMAQLHSLSEPGEYTKEPVQGRHFLVYPDHIQLYANWASVFGVLWKPRADDFETAALDLTD